MYACAPVSPLPAHPPTLSTALPVFQDRLASSPHTHTPPGLPSLPYSSSPSNNNNKRPLTPKSMPPAGTSKTQNSKSSPSAPIQKCVSRVLNPKFLRRVLNSRFLNLTLRLHACEASCVLFRRGQPYNPLQASAIPDLDPKLDAQSPGLCCGCFLPATPLRSPPCSRVHTPVPRGHLLPCPPACHAPEESTSQ